MTQEKEQTTTTHEQRDPEGFEESDEIDDEEISLHEIKAKDMQKRVQQNGKKLKQQDQDLEFSLQIKKSNSLANKKKGEVESGEILEKADIDFQNTMLGSNSEKSQAISLIQVHQDSNRIELGSRALEILCKYSDSKTSFVSIAGIFNSGKSALLNKLLDIKHGEGFKIADVGNQSTQGIWMWSTPQYNEEDDLYIFFIDSEGLQSIEQGQEQDTKIFTLTMLISSFFIYNCKEAIDDQSLGQLSLMPKLAKSIAINEFGELMDDYMLPHYTPSLLWLLRDFSLELVDSQGRKINPSQYLENCLLDESGSSVIRGIKRSILAYFKDRSCLTMVKPVDRDENLKSIDKLEIKELRGDFQQKVVMLRKIILLKCKPKLFNGVALNGRMMCSMIETFVNNINHKDGKPNIHSAWENIVLNECIVAQQGSLHLFEQEMKAIIDDREHAVDFFELYSNFRVIRDKVLDNYDKIAGIREKNNYYHQYRVELISAMEVKEQQAFERNEDLASVQNEDLVKVLSEPIKQKISKDEYSHSTIDTYINELSSFLDKYDGSAAGTKKAETLISQVNQINEGFVSLLVSSIRRDYEGKQESKLQAEQFTQKKEEYYKEQIELLDENIIRFEERIKLQEKQKVQLESEKDKQQKKLEDTRKEVESLQKTIKMDVPELHQIISERNKQIEQLKSEIQQMKKTKKKGCC